MSRSSLDNARAAFCAVALLACSAPASRVDEPSSAAGTQKEATLAYRALRGAPAVRNELARDGVQGLAHDDELWFVTTTHYIWRFPRGPSFVPVGQGVAPFGGRYGHLGDLDAKEGFLFVPLDADRRGGPGGIGALRTDLTAVGFQPFPSVAWCALDPRASRLYASEFDADRVHVMRVEVTAERFALTFERDLVLQRRRGERTEAFGTVHSIQGGAVGRDGKLYLASDHPGSGVLVFDADSGVFLEKIPVDHRPRFGPLTNDEVEGLDLDEGAANGSGRVNETRPASTLHLLLHDEWPRRSYSVMQWLLWSPGALGPSVLGPSAGAPHGVYPAVPAPRR